MFAIRCIAFVCFDRSLSSLHIWFVHSLFSFQRSIAHHVLRDCLFIIPLNQPGVNAFSKYFFEILQTFLNCSSNSYILSNPEPSVNKYFSSGQRINLTTQTVYHLTNTLSILNGMFFKKISPSYEQKDSTD